MFNTWIIVLALFGFNSVYAMSAPEGEPVLWVNGRVSQSNTNGAIVFDEAMLNQLDIRSILTNNHVVDQVVEYRGPTLSSLLENVGATGSQVRVTAWDDYVVTIPISDIEKYGVILATHEAGVKMTIDDKGPLFVVFPFSDYPELRNDFYYSLSIWQVRELFIE